MNRFILFLLVMLLVCEAKAQPKAVHLDPSMFSPTNDILLGDLEGWQFFRGADTGQGSSANPGWQYVKPSELSMRLADPDGKLEGWLKLHFRLDSSFTGMELGFRYYAWASADVYVDGRLFRSYGNTAAGSTSGFNPSNHPPDLVNLSVGTDHCLTIHFVDFVGGFLRPALRSDISDLSKMVRFTGPSYNRRFAEHVRNWPVFGTLFVTVDILLTILFWLLFVTSRRERNLRLLAIVMTLVALQAIAKTGIESNTTGFNQHLLFQLLFVLSNIAAACATIFVVTRIARGNVPRPLRIALGVFAATCLISFVLAGSFTFVLTTVIPLVAYVWLIYTSWRRLKGAQWAIMVGLAATLIFTSLYIFMVVHYNTDFIPYNMAFVSAVTLPPPLSYLVYAALRFREVLLEVEQKASEVLRLSEEKRIQALAQQEYLEKEVARQTVDLKTMLANLQSTQAQLVQSEKMASLGELTAGIAHEIQNPLNFVNNFAEVSHELVDEMKAEWQAGKPEVAVTVAEDLKQNLEKIIHHGKRADAIVKGMLQHSRSSSGLKESTDINGLCDEYLRLAYHGLRAKDKSFNARYETHFDPDLPPVHVVPQDIGRVILNLVNNAFYAVSEKKSKSIEPYDPTVILTTRKLPGKIEITVQDNGPGIPDKIKDKIFQPFFTTKPTGQGTGLGLSLSYDIIKAHGGEIALEENPGQGTIFTIKLTAS